MEDKFFMKMLERAFAQYGREIQTATLPVDDSARLYENLQKARRKDPESKWHELVEDTVYGYITGQESPF